MFDRRLITNFHWAFFLVTLLLALMGLANLYSASSSFEGSGQAYFKAQISWTIIALSVGFFSLFFHYRHLKRLSLVIYILSLVSLVLVLLIGKKVAGHQSWLAIGPFTFQPTETAKLGLIIGLAGYLSDIKLPGSLKLRHLIIPTLFLTGPVVLILAQGDLGSSLFFMLIYGSMLLAYGLDWKMLAAGAVIVVVIAVVGYLFFLSPYQKNRILTFLHPELDHKGSGYHLVQSKIAIGSGGITGRGFLKGQTHRLKFIPERHTDFIFTVFAEEWGFLGGLTVLTVFFIFLYSALIIAYRSVDKFSFFVTMGIISLFFWHLVINLGGILGLMPLTGVPLPFFSYGGSALITNWLCVFLLLNITMRRYLFSEKNSYRIL